MLTSLLVSCGTSAPSDCSLEVEYHIGFAECQLFSLPVVELDFKSGREWTPRMPQVGLNNKYYAEIARYNADSTGSVLVRLAPFKREGKFITVSEQYEAQKYWTLKNEAMDSWITEGNVTKGDWDITIGRYEQEPENNYIIGHYLVLPDTTKNGVLVELLTPMKDIDLKKERCLDEVIRSITLR